MQAGGHRFDPGWLHHIDRIPTPDPRAGRGWCAVTRPRATGTARFGSGLSPLGAPLEGDLDSFSESLVGLGNGSPAEVVAEKCLEWRFEFAG